MESVAFTSTPTSPETARVFPKDTTLTEIRDRMTRSSLDTGLEEKIKAIFNLWKHNPKEVEPYSDIRNVLEAVRSLPHGNERIKKMNTIIRTIGKPEMLATLLDMLRDSAKREGTEEQRICKTKLQAVKMHSIYGWCGNTLSIETHEFPTSGTHPVQEGLEEKLGNSTSAWNLTIHVWQPNKKAKGFSISDTNSSKTILEPPHSHPFDFVSMVVKGSLHQSIYEQIEVNSLTNHIGYYNGAELNHVDGVWPPHDYQSKCCLKTNEHRVLLNEGDSYYMPCDMIHDVEINSEIAVTKPTITLFLSSEYLVMPHVYMIDSMKEYHKNNPDIKKAGKPISEESWHKKLESLSKYLRGESQTIDLNEIVQYEGEYAFFHRI